MSLLRLILSQRRFTQILTKRKHLLVISAVSIVVGPFCKTFWFTDIATGVCLTAIALGHPLMTPNLKAILLVDVGMSYLFAVLSTFAFWRQAARQSQARLH
ncbi:hypothetical protein [uncultured Nostoc sp.]|uniref:hypothetical protein n=1 Tax=uncultured Nostoc sp. TaxID=340711 RepID=UPI0035C9CA28